MVTTVTKHAFVSLAVSAKLHKLLDQVGRQQQRRHEETFDHEVEEALGKLHHASGGGREEELRLLKQDFDILEQLFHDMRSREALPESAAERFDRLFANLREKIKEKGLGT